MTFRDRHPPRAHLLRREIDQPDIAKRGRRLAQQPAQLRHRHRLTGMRLQILLDELDQRQGRRPSARTEPVEHRPKRPLRLPSARESTDLPPAEDWREPYRRLATEVDVEPELDNAYAEAATCLDPILAGRTTGVWDPQRRTWR
jgi:hypothetical protein